MTGPMQVQNVTFSYAAGHPVLQDLTFTVQTGTFLAVVGPNGAGKSTLIHLLAGMLKPRAGTVAIDGIDVQAYNTRALAQKVALVRQEFVPDFGFSVAETVLMARTPYYSQLGFESDADRALVAKALELTDTAQFATRSLASLSGGERQRVFIARALAQDTPLLLLDEPTSFLDLRHQVRIYDLLKSIQLDKGRTIIAVTHDINLAAQYCDDALLLHPLACDSPRTTGDTRSGLPRHYRMGKTAEVFTPEQIEKTFGVSVFSTLVGRAKAFFPLGKMARDANPGDTEPPCPRKLPAQPPKT